MLYHQPHILENSEMHSNICHVNNIYRTRCLSPMYCVNLAELRTLISLLLMFVLKLDHIILLFVAV